MREKIISAATERDIRSVIQQVESLDLNLQKDFSFFIKNIDNDSGDSLRSNLEKTLRSKKIDVLSVGKDELSDYAKEMSELAGLDRTLATDLSSLRALQSDIEDRYSKVIDEMVLRAELYKSERELFLRNSLVDRTEEEAKKFVDDYIKSRYILDDQLITFDRIGAYRRIVRERPAFWVDRNTRASYQKEHIDYIGSVSSTSGQDLVRVSAHADCSDLCAPWQGEVLSNSGLSSEYDSLDNAIAGGLFHVNCRHSIHIYIKGLSDDNLWDKERLPKVEREAMYQKRQQGKYDARQYYKYKDRARRAKDVGETSRWKKYKNLRDTYKAKATDKGVFVT